MKILNFIDELDFLHYIYAVMVLVLFSLLMFILKAPFVVMFLVYVAILAVLIHIIVSIRGVKDDEL